MAGKAVSQKLIKESSDREFVKIWKTLLLNMICT